MARQVASLFGVLRLDDSDYKTKLSSAVRETNSLGQTLSSKGQQLQQFGTGMTAFFAPIGVGLGYAVTQGHNFDRTFSNINSILKYGTEDAAALRAEILRYGSGTVAGPQATAEAYYEIVSGVADASTHMAILEAATRTAEAGQADLGATTSALISTMNSYGFAASDAAYVSDVFTRTVGMGVLTMDELAVAMPQVIGIASEFGIGIDELGGSMAYLTAQGYSASQSATFMKSMMTTLLSPTADLQTAITALGYESGAALLEAEGLTGAYELLSAQNGGLDGLITNTEALNGALVLTNDGYSTFLDTYNSGIAGATDAAGAIQDQTEQWGHLKSQLDGLAIQISDALMPTLNNLVTNYITPVVTAVSEWMLKNPELTTQIGLLVMGLVLAGPVIAGVGTAVAILGGAITFMLSPIGLLIGGLALLAMAYYTNFGGIKDYIDTVVVKSFEELITWGTKLWTGVEPYLFRLYNWFVKDGLPGVWAYLNKHIFPLLGNFTGLIGDLWTLSQPFLEQFYDWFMVSGLPQIQAFINGPVTDAFNAIGGVITGFIDGVNTAITTARSFMGLAENDAFAANGLAPVQGGNVISAGTLSGTRASGGDVEAGKRYLVGEDGPEPFIPRVSGTILPNSAMGGSNDTYHTTIYANSEAEGRAAARGWDDEIQTLKRSRGVTG